MFSRNKKYILDGGTGQTLLEKGLKPEGTLWSATALINEDFHDLVVETHLDFINAGADLIVTNNFGVRKRRLLQNNRLDYFESANRFAGLLAQKAKELSNNNIKCGIALFGETVFSMIPKKDEDKVLKILQKYSDGIVIKSELDDSGARVLSN